MTLYLSSTHLKNKWILKAIILTGLIISRLAVYLRSFRIMLSLPSRPFVLNHFPIRTHGIMLLVSGLIYHLLFYRHISPHQFNRPLVLFARSSLRRLRLYLLVLLPPCSVYCYSPSQLQRIAFFQSVHPVENYVSMLVSCPITT